MRNDSLPFSFTDDDGEANEVSKTIIGGHYWGHVIQIDGTFVADVTVEVRVSASLGFAPLTTVSGQAIVPIGYPVHSVRLTITNYVSGQVVAAYAGYKIR